MRCPRPACTPSVSRPATAGGRPPPSPWWPTGQPSTGCSGSSAAPAGAPKGAGYGWLLVGCGTLASIGGNVAHAQANLVAQAIAAAIPLAVLAMLEGLKGDAGEVTRLAAQAAGLNRAGAFAQPGQVPHATTVRRPDRTANPDNPAAQAMAAQRRALPAGPRPADPTTVGARLQAAYAQPRPDGQAWTARTLAEAAGCGRSSAASFLQRQRPSTEEDAR